MAVPNTQTPSSFSSFSRRGGLPPGPRAHGPPRRLEVLATTAVRPGAALGDDDAVGPGGVGGVDHRPQVVGSESSSHTTIRGLALSRAALRMSSTVAYSRQRPGR